MAAPITHIVLAEKIFDEHFSSFDRKDFLLGTLFPDIRYLKVIDRDMSHFKNLKITDLTGGNSFLAGVKFHSIVDEARDLYLASKDVYEWLPKSKFIHTALKFVEDKLLYDKLHHPGELSAIFSRIPYDQIGFPVAAADIDRWYSLIRDYCSSRPSDTAIERCLHEMGFGKDEINEIIDLMQQVMEDIKYPKIVHDFYENY